MTKRGILLLGLTGLGLILLFALYHGNEKIRQDLTFRGKAALSEQTLAWATLEVDGRNLHLRGEAPSAPAADQALRQLEALDGVNRVIDESTLPPATDGAKPTGDAPWSSSVKAR